VCDASGTIGIGADDVTGDSTGCRCFGTLGRTANCEKKGNDDSSEENHREPV
jgi:hypothetical protein